MGRLSNISGKKTKKFKGLQKKGKKMLRFINNNLSINLKKFTWDYPDKVFSEEKFLSSSELVSRILKYGSIDEWVWITHKLNKEGIKKFLEHSGYKLDDRTFNWWRIYCGFNDTFQRTERDIGSIKKISPIK